MQNGVTRTAFEPARLRSASDMGVGGISPPPGAAIASRGPAEKLTAAVQWEYLRQFADRAACKPGASTAIWTMSASAT